MTKVYIGIGHGGNDNGAVGYIVEDETNLKMGKACRDYLEARGIETMISRESDVNVSIATKTSQANKWGADLALDIHNNAGGGDGAEVYHSIYYGTGKTLSDNILDELKKIGQNSRGSKTRKGTNGDYYAFIRNTSMPSVITEAVFTDTKSDAAQADTDAECKMFGEAIAKGIIRTLISMGKYTESNDVFYITHIQSYGWDGKLDDKSTWKKNGQTSGTTGQAKRLEAIIIDSDVANFKYQVHCQTHGDMPLVKNGELAGTTGQSKRLESIRIECDKKIKYRVHIQTYGWTEWVGNGTWCGTKGESKRLEAIEIKFV